MSTTIKKKGFSISCFDALGTTIGIRYDGNNRTKTGIGGFLTVLFIFIAIVTITFFYNLYVTGGDLKMSNSISKIWDFQKITFNNTFKIGANTIYNKANWTDKVYNIKATYVSINTINYQTTRKDLEMYPCKSEDWLDSSDQFINLNLKNALCVNTDNVTISGSYNTELFNYIDISFNINMNISNTTEVNYYREEIEKLYPLASIYILEGMIELNKKSIVKSHFINSFTSNMTDF